jgi:hypothetical protein
VTDIQSTVTRGHSLLFVEWNLQFNFRHDDSLHAWRPRLARCSGHRATDPRRLDETVEQNARWILAYTLDWHRRELKTVYCERYRLSDLPQEDLMDERCALSGLTFVDNAGGTLAAPVHRYRFPPQEVELRGGESLLMAGSGR